jgi:hypothetical protein
MGSVLHGSARTTPCVRAELQASQESSRALAPRYGLNPKTVRKWRKRTGDTVLEALRAIAFSSLLDDVAVGHNGQRLELDLSKLTRAQAAGFRELTVYETWKAGTHRRQVRVRMGAHRLFALSRLLRALERLEGGAPPGQGRPPGGQGLPQGNRRARRVPRQAVESVQEAAHWAAFVHFETDSFSRLPGEGGGRRPTDEGSAGAGRLRAFWRGRRCRQSSRAGAALIRPLRGHLLPASGRRDCCARHSTAP